MAWARGNIFDGYKKRACEEICFEGEDMTKKELFLALHEIGVRGISLAKRAARSIELGDMNGDAEITFGMVSNWALSKSDVTVASSRKHLSDSDLLDIERVIRKASRSVSV
jgi:hypothetical protein